MPAGSKTTVALYNISFIFLPFTKVDYDRINKSKWTFGLTTHKTLKTKDLLSPLYSPHQSKSPQVQMDWHLVHISPNGLD